MKSKLLVLSTALMLVLAGCSGNNNQSFTPASSGSESGSGSQSQATVTGVTLDKTELALTVGQTATLVATVIPAGAADVVWSSSSAHATVDDGLVTAVSAGPAIITASAGDYSASCVVTVSEAQKVDIAYSDGTFEFNGNQQPGKFVYWAGDGGAVSSATYNAGTGKYSLTYTTGWAWYGVQIFYLLPYAEAEDLFDITWVVNSTVAGSITVNGAVQNLTVGENTISFTNTGLDAQRTLNVQLGVNGGAQFGNGTFSFGNPVVYDKSGNTYHEISFLKDSTVLKKIPVKSGKLVTAPEDPAAPAGQVFVGWYDGEVKFDATQAVTAPHAYTAKFLDESLVTKYTVSVYDGSTLLGTVQVVEGSKVDLSSIEFPFGYESDGYFKNNGLTDPFNPAVEVITANTTIYAKKRVAVTGSCYNMYESYVTHLEDGSLQIKLEGWGSDIWAVQLNYLLPVGNHNYTIDFHYSIDKAGADALIYDGGTKGNVATLEVGNNVAKTISYNGALTAQNKLTFELGALPAGQVATFVLHDITLLLS